MQMENEEQSCPGESNIMDRRGSFFKLIHTFASEIGELNSEMALADREPSEGVLQWLEGQMTGVYMQSPTFADPTTPRDSGYDSLRRHMSVLDRLKQTHSVWLLLGLGDEEAVRILQSQPPGVFLVRKSAKLKRKVISLRMDSFSDAVVRDFPVKETQYTFCLEGSGIGFPDLFRMVAFYCISRDVLPFTLELPEAIASARTRANLQDIAQLGAEFWDSALCRIKGAGLDQTGQTAEEGCPAATWIHLPSQSSVALCFINPLFYQESQPQKDPVRPPSPKTAPLSSSSRCPESAQGKRRMPEMAYWINPESQLPGTTALGGQTEMEKIMFRYLSQISGYSTQLEEDISALTCGQYDEVATASRERVDSDNRMSYMSTSTSSSDSPPLDLGTCRRLGRGMTDSSVEEEEEEDEGEVVEFEDEDCNVSTESDQEVSTRPAGRVRKRSSVSSARLSQALRRPIHRMMDTLVIPERRASRQVQRLVHDKTSYFSCLVQDFINYIRKNHSCHESGQDLLQTLRQFLTQTKNYLFQSSELNPPIHSFIPEHQIDQVLEKAIQKCVLKPLKSMLVSALQDFQKKNGEWQRLEENMALAKKKSPQELGVENGCTLDPGTIEKIRQKFQAMRKMYSPEKKVDVLLQVCSLIYSTMEKSSGADDFLPMLTFTLAQCNMPDLDIEIQYMMELLDPFQLNGEGGYYLTSTYGAMSLIKNLQKEQETQELISETRNTLRQWHRRLTAQRSTPAIEDLQNYLRVAYLDANGIYTTKTLPVAPYSTTGDVCQLCAEKFQITGPESHGLFLVIGEGWQQLSPDSFPQSIKADIHSQRLTFSFVYRQVSELGSPPR
ncbi:ras and Rab interactor 2-like [Paramormyrops kingsleyae]|uniref:ras and Rab interactor 2-like n=1 Tax=Paramormyrops kingsleyae TaxID=1676925 RepID=UPI003B9713DB